MDKRVRDVFIDNQIRDIINDIVGDESLDYISLDEKKEIYKTRDFLDDDNISELYLKLSLSDLCYNYVKTYSITEPKNIEIITNNIKTISHFDIMMIHKSIDYNGASSFDFFKKYLFTRVYFVNNTIKSTIDLYYIKTTKNNIDIQKQIAPIQAITDFNYFILALTDYKFSVDRSDTTEKRFNDIYDNYKEKFKYLDTLTYSTYKKGIEYPSPNDNKFGGGIPKLFIDNINKYIEEIQLIIAEKFINQTPPNQINIKKFSIVNEANKKLQSEVIDFVDGTKRNIELNNFDIENIKHTKKEDFIDKNNKYMTDTSMQAKSIIKVFKLAKKGDLKQNEVMEYEGAFYSIDNEKVGGITLDLSKPTEQILTELRDLTHNKIIKKFYEKAEEFGWKGKKKISLKEFNEKLDAINNFIESITTNIRAYDPISKEELEPIRFNIPIFLEDFEDINGTKEKNYRIRQQYIHSMIFLRNLKYSKKESVILGNPNNKPQFIESELNYYTTAYYLPDNKAMFLKINEEVAREILRNYYVNRDFKQITIAPTSNEPKQIKKDTTPIIKRAFKFYDLYLYKNLIGNLKQKLEDLSKIDNITLCKALYGTDKVIDKTKAIKEWYYNDSDINGITPRQSFTIEALKSDLIECGIINLSKKSRPSKKQSAEKTKRCFDLLSDKLDYVAPKLYDFIKDSSRKEIEINGKKRKETNLQLKHRFNNIKIHIRLKIDDKELEQLIKKYVNSSKE